MVRYVFNSWRDRRELLLVRQQFYGSSTTDEGERRDAQVGQRLAGVPTSQQERQQRQRAVARVSMWMARQHCPHTVESTALLTAAILSDERAGAVDENALVTYAVRATYATAFSRFVTGLLDGHQDKQRKQSMYVIAKKIGLPATFVELRHQSTHDQLPSRAKLRSMASKALAWIWDYYWKNLTEASDGQVDGCREAILKYLCAPDEAQGRLRAAQKLKEWDSEQVMRTIKDLQASLPGNQAYLKCLKLSKEISQAAEMGVVTTRAVPAGAEPREPAAADAPVEQELEPKPNPKPSPTLGWALYAGPWKSKPIGVV